MASGSASSVNDWQTVQHPDVNDWQTVTPSAPVPLSQNQVEQPDAISRFFGEGLNPVFHSLDQLSDSSTPWSERLNDVANSIPFVQPLKESVHAFNRLIGIEPSNGSPTVRDVLRSVPVVGPMVQQPFEQMYSGDVAGGLGSLAQDALGLKMARASSRSLHYPEPVQPVEEGVRNIWNPTSKKNVANVYNPKAGEFAAPPLPPPGGSLSHAVRAGAPDVIQGAAKLGGGIAVSHVLPHWAQAMMGYPEYSGAKQIGEGLSKGYQAFTPPLARDTRMMNVTPFDLGTPEPPSAMQSWQPQQPTVPDIGIPQTTTPSGRIPGGPQNIPPPAPPPTRWVSPLEGQVAPSPLVAPRPVEPIPATATPSGRVVPSVEDRIARANSPSVSPEESLANIQQFTGNLKRGAKNQTFIQPNIGVVIPSQAAPFANPLESQVSAVSPASGALANPPVEISPVSAYKPGVHGGEESGQMAKGAAMRKWAKAKAAQQAAPPPPAAPPVAAQPDTNPLTDVAPTIKVPEPSAAAQPAPAVATTPAPTTLEDQPRAPLPPEMAAQVPPAAAQPAVPDITSAVSGLQPGPGNLVRIDKLREQFPGLTKEQFDKTALESARNGNLVLSRYDGPRENGSPSLPGLTPNHVVTDELGQHYIGAAIPRVESISPVTAAPQSGLLQSTLGGKEPPPPAGNAGQLLGKGLLQKSEDLVRNSPDKNAQEIAEKNLEIGLRNTVAKNQNIGKYLADNNMTGDKWSALSMDEKNKWIDRVNEERWKSLPDDLKKKASNKDGTMKKNFGYKYFGEDYDPSADPIRQGRHADVGAAHVEDELRRINGEPPRVGGPAPLPPISSFEKK